MTYAGFAHMSRTRLVVFLALMIPGTIFCLALPFISPDDASYLLATVVGMGALAVLLDWSLSRRLRGHGRARALIVDVLPTAGIVLAFLVWGDALGWSRWPVLFVVIVLTTLSVLKKFVADRRIA